MKESVVEAHIMRHLADHGWKVTTSPKLPGQHGIDIKAWHSKLRRNVLIEVKGGSGKHRHQELHNSFYVVLGQLVARMDIEGNRNNRGRIYGIGIPCAWAVAFKKKISKMKFGWALLRPRVYLVEESGNVIEKPYSYFLRK